MHCYLQIFYFVVLVTSCAPNYNCFKDSNDNAWVVQKTISNLTCDEQCEEALCHTGIPHACDATRSITRPQLNKMLNFTCHVKERCGSHVVVSLEKKLCFVSNKNGNCDEKSISICANEAVVPVCPCKPAIIQEKTHRKGSCAARINYWRAKACTEHWSECPACGLPPMSECADCHLCANLQAQSKKHTSCGTQVQSLVQATTCANAIDLLMSKPHQKQKILQSGTRKFSWGKNLLKFVFNWNSCDKETCAQKQPVASFFSLTSACNIDNGGCDALTTCNDTMSGPECGPCPAGFSGNGSTGCQDINECLNSSACTFGTACANTNLSNVNFTRDDVCVCIGNDCLYVDAFPNAPNAVGQYSCTHYTQFMYNHDQIGQYCDTYQQQNGNFNFTSTATIRSNQPGCNNTYTRWNLVNENLSTLILQSVRMNSRVDPSQVKYLLPDVDVDCVLPSCTTLSGCTEVLSCGKDQKCAINPGTCINLTSGEYILFDGFNASLFPGCFYYDPISLGNNPQAIMTTASPIQSSNQCMDLEGMPQFNINGQFCCTADGTQGCNVYANVHRYKLYHTTPFSPFTTNCSDDFAWVLSNGTFNTSGISLSTHNPKPATATFVENITFRTCVQAYNCAPCPNPYNPNGFSNCALNRCELSTPFPLCRAGHACANSTCSGCLPGYSAVGGLCSPIITTATVHVRVLNSHNSVLFSEVLLQSSPGPLKIDVYNVTNSHFALTPAPYQLVAFAGTNTSLVTFKINPGAYTMFSYVSLASLPLNGIGNRNVQLVAGDDLFVTLYVVPRGILNAATRSATVLSWSSTGNTVFVNLDLIFQKYDPVSLSACFAASCCTATPQNGLCGTVQIMNDSRTPDGVEEAYLTSTETIGLPSPGAVYSYLVYVRLMPPDNPALFKTSDAQIRIFNSASARNYLFGFNLIATPAQIADGSFTASYWPVCCLTLSSPSGIITVKNITEPTNTSVLIYVAPLASIYCT